MVEFLESNCIKLVVIAGVLSVIAVMILVSGGNGHGGYNRIEEDLTREHRQRVTEPMAGHPGQWAEQSRWR